MLTKLLQLTLVMLIGIISAVAQEKSVPTKAELIGQFAALTKANRININVKLSLDDVKKRMSPMIEDDKDLTEPQKQELRKIATDIFKRLIQQTEKLLSESQILTKLGEQVIIDVYDKAFTEPELVDLIAFFKTPLGQKTADFLSTSNVMIERDFKTRMESKIQEISQPLINSSTEELRQRVKEEKKK